MTVRILIVGTGAMAQEHARAFQQIPGVEIVAAVDTNLSALEPFCRTFGIPNKFPSVEDAVAFGEFDAATVVTPDAFHHVCTMPLLLAQKHVLCEKPLATGTADAQEMTSAARAACVVNMVNFTYRRSGALAKAAAMVRDGDLGEIRHFDASYLQDWLLRPGWETIPFFLWRLSSAHGSLGTLGDLGVHILDFAIYATNAFPSHLSCRLKTYEKAIGNQIGEYVLDANDTFNIHLEMDNGAIGTIQSSRVAHGHRNDLRLTIYGTAGAVEVTEVDGVCGLKASFGGDAEERSWDEISFDAAPTVFERFVAAIADNACTGPDFAYGTDIQRLLEIALISDRNDSRLVEVPANSLE